MAEEPKKNKNNIEKTGIGWYDRARERVQSTARMGTKYRPESAWAGRLIPRQDGDISMDVLRESNPRLFNSNQAQNQSQARVPLSSPNPSTSSATSRGSGAAPGSSSRSGGSGGSTSKPKSTPSESTEGMLSRLIDAISFDSGPNDSPIRSVGNVNPASSLLTNPNRSSQMAGALASRISVPPRVSMGSGVGQSGSASGSLADSPTTQQLAGALFDPNIQRVGENLVDAASSVFASMRAARTRVPEFEPSQGYRDVQSRLMANSNVGVTAAEQSAFQSNLDRTAAMGLDSISRFAAAGGSSGAALGAIGRLGASQSTAQGQFAMQDQSMANQNLARLAAFESSNRQMDYGQIFLPQREQAISDRTQLTQAALLNRRQISDRNDYYNTFIDPNSAYQRMEEAKIATQQRIANSIDTLENSELNMGGTNSLYALSDTEMNDRKTSGYFRNAGIERYMPGYRGRNNSPLNTRQR